MPIAIHPWISEAPFPALSMPPLVLYWVLPNFLAPDFPLSLRFVVVVVVVVAVSLLALGFSARDLLSRQHFLLVDLFHLVAVAVVAAAPLGFGPFARVPLFEQHRSLVAAVAAPPDLGFSPRDLPPFLFVLDRGMTGPLGVSPPALEFAPINLPVQKGLLRIRRDGMTKPRWPALDPPGVPPIRS